MPGLSASQLEVIRTLIDTAPDAAIRSLDMALASEQGETSMGAIRDLVSLEAGERRARSMVFAPVMPLCPKGEPSFEHETFPVRAPTLIWRALKIAEPGRFHAAMVASVSTPDDAGPPLVFDELTAAAAAGLRNAAGTPFAVAAELLDQSEEGAAIAFADYLDLSPLARSAQARLGEWVGHMTEERAAQVRLAFRDACNIAPDASPRFLEMLLCRLDEPWQVLRIVSAITDRATDTFLAGSELAHVGERLMADIDRRLDDLTSFDPVGGSAAGVSAAEAARAAIAEIGEFELALDIKKEGPWGKRLVRQKQTLSAKVESLLNKTDDAVGAALPLKSVKLGKMTRGAPNYRNPADPRAVAKAEGLLTFLDQVRSAAAAGGYSSLRGKTIEKLDERLDRYVEDVLDHLRAPDAEQADVAREYLNIAANLVGLYRDERAAQIVRRRAAA